MNTPSPASESAEGLRVVERWLENLGDKFLGDGVQDSLRASTILNAIRAAALAAPPVPLSDERTPKPPCPCPLVTGPCTFPQCGHFLE